MGVGVLHGRMGHTHGHAHGQHGNAAWGSPPPLAGCCRVLRALLPLLPLLPLPGAR